MLFSPRGMPYPRDMCSANVISLFQDILDRFSPIFTNGKYLDVDYWSDLLLPTAQGILP